MTTLQLVLSHGSAVYAGLTIGVTFGWVARSRIYESKAIWEPKVYERLHDDSVPVRLLMHDDDCDWRVADAESYADRVTVAEAEALHN